MSKGVRRSLVILLGLILLAVLLALFTNIYRIMVPCYVRGETVPSRYGDLILVLGGGLRSGLRLGFSTRERMDLAVWLYHEHPRKILVSDGSLYAGSRARRVFRDYLQNRGINPSDILLEGKSQTTYESLQATRPMVKKYSREAVVICTSPYHQKRVAIILKELEPPYQYLIARMEESEIYQARSLHQRIRNIGLLVRETGALFKYRLFPGHRSDLEHGKKKRY